MFIAPSWRALARAYELLEFVDLVGQGDAIESLLGGRADAGSIRSGADRARHVHVAASLFHDVAPCAQLGLRCVWINRLGERSELLRAGELPDLVALAVTLEALVPA